MLCFIDFSVEFLLIQGRIVGEEVVGESFVLCFRKYLYSSGVVGEFKVVYFSTFQTKVVDFFILQSF